MMVQLDPSEVYDRGLKDYTMLTPLERLVFLVMELETRMDMDGWDDFFAYGQRGWFQELLSGLQTAGDTQSAKVLLDYKTWLSGHDTACEPLAIQALLADGVDTERLAGCRDWREEFTELVENRWQKVGDYLRLRGFELLT